MAGVSVDQPLNRCFSDEQKAQQQLGSDWSTYSASSRESCSSLENIGDAHSYVSLLACLQMYNQPK
jgi:hypothetical protein